MTRREARFAVGTRQGPRSTIWKAWVQKDEAYIASRMFGSDMKVSLHSSGACQWSATNNWVIRQPAARNADRHVVRWQVSHPDGNEALLLFRVEIPVSEVRPLPPPTDKKKVFWVNGAPPDATIRFLFYMTRPLDHEPPAAGTERMRHLFSLGLRNQRWLVAFVEVISLSASDLSNARRSVIAQLAENSVYSGDDHRLSLFIQPGPDGGAHGLLEICATEAEPRHAADSHQRASPAGSCR